MKQELRCHAVLCPSEKKARLMATRLQERLHQALVDFRKEKMSRQNARLSLANSIYENPTMPCRKILLHTGSSNYRPSPDRAKSAPKLKASHVPYPLCNLTGHGNGVSPRPLFWQPLAIIVCHMYAFPMLRDRL